MPKSEYSDVTLRNVSSGYRGITTTSPSELDHSRTLDPGEVVTVSLTQKELEEVMAAGDFELADAADAKRKGAAQDASASTAARASASSTPPNSSLTTPSPTASRLAGRLSGVGSAPEVSRPPSSSPTT